MAQEDSASQFPEESTGGLSSPPSISPPKGWGAIHGIGEKFAANPVTGTGSMSVPIATRPVCSGFGSQLLLTYDSVSVNWPFGFGWSLSLFAITSKTDKGPPRYLDSEESDVYILSGSEDIVLGPRSNSTRFVGEDTDSDDIEDPKPTCTFSYLICDTHYDKDCVVIYKYKKKNLQGINKAHICKRNRGDFNHSRWATARSIKKIFCGNPTPMLDETGNHSRMITKYSRGER